jgi:hypothetical protein
MFLDRATGGGARLPSCSPAGPAASPSHPLQLPWRGNSFQVWEAPILLVQDALVRGF